METTIMEITTTTETIIIITIATAHPTHHQDQITAAKSATIVAIIMETGMEITVATHHRDQMKTKDVETDAEPTTR